MPHEVGHELNITEDLGLTGGTPTIGGGTTLSGDEFLESGELNPAYAGTLAPGLLEMMETLEIDKDKLQYFEQYDPIKEEMAGLTRGQSELEAKRGFGQAVSGAQAQVGQSIGQAYAKGRGGGGGFGGTSPSVAGSGAQAMRGYGQARAGAQQQMQGQMFDAQMTEAKAIRGSQEAYKQQVMQLLGMLGD